MNLFSLWTPHAPALPGRLLGVMTNALRLGVGSLWLAGVGMAGDVSPLEAPLGGVERVLYELENTASIDAESLLGTLVVSGPKGYSQLLKLSQGVAIDGIEPLKKTTQRQVASALRGIPSVVQGRLQSSGRSPRRVEVESKLMLRIYGDVGSATDLPTVLNYLTEEGRKVDASASIASAGLQTIEKLLERDARSFGVLRSLFPGLDLQTRAAVLRALGRSPSEASLTFLENLLGRESELESALFGEIGRVVEVGRLTASSRTLTFIQSKLYSQDSAILRQSCLTLGRLGDVDAVGGLIELLENEDRGAAANAHWALERITGKKLKPDPARWLKWWRAELTWWEEQSYGVIQRLHGDDVGEVGAALRELSGHGLHRGELAREVSSILNHRNPSVVSQACAVLEALGSSVAVLPLQELIQRGPDVSTPHAERALARSLAKR